MLIKRNWVLGTLTKQFVIRALLLPRVAKRAIALITDASFCILAVWFSLYLRLGEFVQLSSDALAAVAASIGLALPIFVVSGLYRAIFRYSGWFAFTALARAISIYGLLYASIFTAIGITGVPRTVGIIQPILLLLFVGSSRLLAREWLGEQYRTILKSETRPNVLIYGAGSMGQQMVAAIASSNSMNVVGFLDADERLHGCTLNGLPVFSPTDLFDIVLERDICNVLLAMPNISRKQRSEILSQVGMAGVTVRTLPSLIDLAEGKVSVSELREFDIADLLARRPVSPDPKLLSANVAGKVVLVTGAGGSIGCELCRQIVALGPAKLILLEQSEYALYAIHQELEQKLPGREAVLVPILASVQDEDRIHAVLSMWRPVTVYHAAAYKHVPLVEYNPAEGVKNNVFGTLCTARAARDCGVRHFVLVSTDKAVRPTNIMGASKRLAEMVLQALALVGGDTKFTMVRFGNVLGSSGSVVPKFKQQIRDGDPITITHPEITRYFMTIPEAAQLVIQASAMAQGGDVFVLDMGLPVKIVDLAHRMIELSGLTVRDDINPHGDIEIRISGLRPGEKLYEELLIGDDPQRTSHPRIIQAHEHFMLWGELNPWLSKLAATLAGNDANEIRKMMMQLVTDYNPSGESGDYSNPEQDIDANSLVAAV